MFRNEKFAKEIMKGLSLVIRENPSFERYGLITITDVVVNPGLDKAKIFISSMNHPRDLTKLLNTKVRSLVKALHNKVNLRKIPTLTFEYDITNERLDMIEKIMLGEE